MKLEHLIICRDSIIDREKNTVSVFEIIEGLVVKAGVKVVTLPFHLLIVFRRESEIGEKDFSYDLVVMNPIGKEIVKIHLPTRIEAQHRRSRLRVNGTFSIDSSGDYIFRVLNQDEVMGEALLGVNFECIEGAR